MKLPVGVGANLVIGVAACGIGFQQWRILRYAFVQARCLHKGCHPVGGMPNLRAGALSD